MPFHPFGYPFEIRAAMPVDQAKASIRKRLKPWFDVRTGARGWLCGPLLCLWNSAFDSQGPMIVARMIQEHGETRIRGYAGANINGAIALTGGALLLTAFSAIVQPQLLAFLLPAMTILIGGGLVAFHLTRREADGLVRFLEASLTPHKLRPAWRRRPATIARDIKVIVNGEVVGGTVTQDSIEALAASLKSDSFMVLELDAERYLQTVAVGDDFLIEMREGNEANHFQATRLSGGGELFAQDETIEALLTYAAGEPAPSFLVWKPRY